MNNRVFALIAALVFLSGMYVFWPSAPTPKPVMIPSAKVLAGQPVIAPAPAPLPPVRPVVPAKKKPAPVKKPARIKPAPAAVKPAPVEEAEPVRNPYTYGGPGSADFN